MEVYADTEKNDSLKKLVQVFTEQINRSQQKQWAILQPLLIKEMVFT